MPSTFTTPSSGSSTVAASKLGRQAALHARAVSCSHHPLPLTLTRSLSLGSDVGQIISYPSRKPARENLVWRRSYGTGLVSICARPCPQQRVRACKPMCQPPPHPRVSEQLRQRRCNPPTVTHTHAYTHAHATTYGSKETPRATCPRRRAAKRVRSLRRRQFESKHIAAATAALARSLHVIRRRGGSVPSAALDVTHGQSRQRAPTGTGTLTHTPRSSPSRCRLFERRFVITCYRK